MFGPGGASVILGPEENETVEGVFTWGGVGGDEEELVHLLLRPFKVRTMKLFILHSPPIDEIHPV